MKTKKTIGMELRSLNLILRRGKLSSKFKHEDSITMMQGRIVTYLFINRNKDVFQRDIEQAFEIRKPTVTKLLQTMEKNGMITRHGVDYDARLKKILLTEKGVQLHDEMINRIKGFEETLTKGLTEEEIETFIMIIEKIKKNLE